MMNLVGLNVSGSESQIAVHCLIPVRALVASSSGVYKCLPDSSQKGFA